MAKLPSFDALDAFGSITIRVFIRNLWRVKLAGFLFRIAARVLRCKVEIVVRD